MSFPYLLYEFSRNSSAGLLRYGRSFSTESNRADAPPKVDEAETVRASPPPSEKVMFLYCPLMGQAFC